MLAGLYAFGYLKHGLGKYGLGYVPSMPPHNEVGGIRGRGRTVADVGGFVRVDNSHFALGEVLLWDWIIFCHACNKNLFHFQSFLPVDF